MSRYPSYFSKDELTFYAIRSRGPGGQNVNKVSSAALLIWDFQTSKVLDRVQKSKILQKMKAQVNRDGLIFIRSDEFRDLERNKARCIEKLLKYLERAFHVDKERVATKPTFSSKRKRVEDKRHRGNLKRERGGSCP